MSSRNSVDQAIVPLEAIANAVLFLRGRKVILDADLARLYGTTTKRLNEQVRRNPDRFPADFTFQLTDDEANSLRSQNATSSLWGGRRYPPHAFTEHGALMAASVLNTPRAVEVTICDLKMSLRSNLRSHSATSSQ